MTWKPLVNNQVVLNVILSSYAGLITLIKYHIIQNNV